MFVITQWRILCTNYVYSIQQTIYGILSFELHWSGLRLWYDSFLLFSKCMAEMASMAIWAHNPSKDHSADFSFVAWVADHWAKLPNTMSKLAVVSIWTCSSFLPLITQLSLEHPLVIHYHFKRLFLFLPSTHIYLLLYTITTTNNINIYKTRSPQLFRIYSNIQV